MTIECRRIDIHDQLFQQELDLRDSVLRRPLGRVSSCDEQAHDNDGNHFVAIRGREVLGCPGLYIKWPCVALLRLMAVRESERGRGVGSQLVAFAVEWAIANRFGEFEGEVRVAAAKFYERCRFRAEGAEYVRHGVPHLKMRWKIRSEM